MLNKYIKILIVSIFIIFVAVQAGQRFVLDEIDFPIVSHETSQTGKPIYYRGEESPSHVGTYHPTLYINSLAVFIKVFGYSETSVRFFGAVCTLISAYLLILILRMLIKKNEVAENIFLGLFLLNPYTIANTTLPDIDSTVLPVVILLFMLYSLKYLLVQKDRSNKVIIILGSLFAIALWSKLTTPLIIPPFLACLALITTKNYKESLILTIKITLIGILAFVISYFLYCQLLGLSTTYTYSFLLESFAKGTSNDGPIEGALNNLENARYFVYWLTLPLVGLFGVSFIGNMLDDNKNEKTKIIKLLVATSLFITVFYIALISPFGGFFKYPFPVFGLMILAIALFYDRHFKDTKIDWLYGFIALIMGFAIEKIFWEDKMFSNIKPFEGFLILLIIIVASYLLIRIKKNIIVSNVFVLFILFTVGFQTSISRIQATSSHPTKYHYGQSGLEETTSYLGLNIEQNEVIWAMKDVGYYTSNRYIESYSYYFSEPLQNDLINMIKDSKVRYYVVTTGIGQDNIDYYANIKKILNENATKEKQFGNFIIYKSKE